MWCASLWCHNDVLCGIRLYNVWCERKLLGVEVHKPKSINYILVLVMITIISVLKWFEFIMRGWNVAADMLISASVLNFFSARFKQAHKHVFKDVLMHSGGFVLYIAPEIPKMFFFHVLCSFLDNVISIQQKCWYYLKLVTLEELLLYDLAFKNVIIMKYLI